MGSFCDFLIGHRSRVATVRLVVTCHENEAMQARPWWSLGCRSLAGGGGGGNGGACKTQAVAVGAVGLMRNLPELADRVQGLT